MSEGGSYPNQGLPVQGGCIFCGRAPIAGETYGPEPDQWDFTNICPECWDKTTDDTVED